MRGSGKNKPRLIVKRKVPKKEQEYNFWVYGPGPYVGGKKWYSGPYDTYNEALDESAGYDKVVKHRKDWMPKED